MLVFGTPARVHWTNWTELDTFLSFYCPIGFVHHRPQKEIVDVESGHQETGLAIFDLTIVGAFVVPSTGVAVSGNSAGSLVDVETGRVLMNFSADTEGHGLAATAFAKNAETIAIFEAKQTLVEKLTADVLAQMEGQTHLPVAMSK